MVLVGIEKDILVTRRGLGHEAVPISLEVLKSVMNTGGVVTAGSCYGFVAGLVEGLDLVEVQYWAKRLVEKLNGRDDIRVTGVSLSEVLERGKGLLD